MPHHLDVVDPAAETAKYECLQCGSIVEATSNPGACPDCDGEFQNRANSLE